MHAYLIIGKDLSAVSEKANKIVKEHRAILLNFPLAKIEDTRELGKFLKLSTKNTTAIFIKEIDKSTKEALNAFLKNLEEPQQNIIFILSASNEYKILSTIISRCQIIRVQSNVAMTNSHFARNFQNKNSGEKLLELSNIRTKDEAIAFIERFLDSLHLILIENDNKKRTARVYKKANDALKALYANGNVTLQLANFVINI